MSLIIALIIILVLIVLWIIVIVSMILVLYGSFTTRVPFVPIPRYIVEALKDAVPLKRGDVFYDLGSGDGRVVLAMAKAFPQARAVGVEKAPFPYIVSRLKLFAARLKNATFLFKNFSNMSFVDATHVYMYLYPETVNKLAEKFEQELKPGTQVVTCDFPIRSRTPRKTIPLTRKKRTYTLYLYEF